MLAHRRWIAACLAMLAVVVRTSAAGLTLPLVDGELAGDFVPLNRADGAKLHWQIDVHRVAPNERTVHIVMRGPGADVQTEAHLDDTGNGTWRIVKATVDLGAWFAPGLSAAGFNVGQMSLQGTLTLTGEGTWRDGQFAGAVKLALREGHFDDPGRKFSLAGISLDLAVDDIAHLRTATAQRLTWMNGHYDVIQLGGGHIVFSMVGDSVHVDNAAVAAFAGQLVLGAFDFSFARPVATVVARVVGAEVALFLPLLPPMVTDAKGRVDGTVTLRRDSSGIQIGEGRLALRRGESAELRLMPTPGLLSASLPATVKKYYPGLADLEAGKVPLTAELLEVAFTPQGDAEGRTATVHVVGGPVDPRLRAPVDLTLNVRGPLEWLIKFGTDSRLHWGH
jgi:hypothetical protein